MGAADPATLFTQMGRRLAPRACKPFGLSHSTETLRSSKIITPKIFKEIILLNENQINSFAGNMILLKNKKNANFLIMSNSAYNSLSSHQIDNIQSHVKIIKSNLSTIEYYGGGGARCMITELFF